MIGCRFLGVTEFKKTGVTKFLFWPFDTDYNTDFVGHGLCWTQVSNPVFFCVGRRSFVRASKSNGSPPYKKQRVSLAGNGC